MNVKLSLRKKFRNSYLHNKVDATALDCGSENDDEIENSVPCYKNVPPNTAQTNGISTNTTENIQQESASPVRNIKICTI